MDTTLISLRTVIGSPMSLVAPAFQIMELQIPNQVVKWSPRQRLLTIEDLAHHTRFLGTAALYGNRFLLADYTDWLKVLAKKLGFHRESLARSVNILSAAARSVLAEADSERFSEYCAIAENNLVSPDTPDNVYDKEPGIGNLYVRQYLEALLGGKRSYSTQLVHNLVSQGKTLIDLYDELFIPSQQELGYLWHNGKISVVQEHYVTAATQAIISGLYGQFFHDASDDNPTMFAACAEGELHEIGIRYIADYFQSVGWNTRYFGSNVPGEDLLHEIMAKKPAVVALSATLAIHLPNVESLIRQLKMQKDYDPAILIGGHAVSVSGDLWQKLGADGSALRAQKAYAIAEDRVHRHHL